MLGLGCQWYATSYDYINVGGFNTQTLEEVYWPYEDWKRLGGRVRGLWDITNEKNRLVHRQNGSYSFELPLVKVDAEVDYTTVLLKKLSKVIHFEAEGNLFWINGVAFINNTSGKAWRVLDMSYSSRWKAYYITFSDGVKYYVGRRVDACVVFVREQGGMSVMRTTLKDYRACKLGAWRGETELPDWSVKELMMHRRY